jgi:hypothetical protein
MLRARSVAPVSKPALAKIAWSSFENASFAIFRCDLAAPVLKPERALRLHAARKLFQLWRCHDAIAISFGRRGAALDKFFGPMVVVAVVIISATIASCRRRRSALTEAFDFLRASEEEGGGLDGRC